MLKRSAPIKRTQFKAKAKAKPLRQRARKPAGVGSTKDGRVILRGRDAWAESRLRNWTAAGGLCAACGKPVGLDEFESDHIRRRGMGGGKRDDYDANIRVMHPRCHFERHLRPDPVERGSDE